MRTYSRFLGEVFLSFLFLFIFLSSPKVAQSAPINVTMVRGGQNESGIKAAIRLEIPEGWHVYAPSPPGKTGAGFPPQIKWQKKSRNIRDMDITWPKSKKEELKGQAAYVYKGTNYVTLHIVPIEGEKPLEVNGKFSFLACSDVCVPMDIHLLLPVKPGEKKDRLFPEEEEGHTQETSLFVFLLIAFVGGLILNCMPCVLPVLSLKLMSLIKQSKKAEQRHAKAGFFVTGLGILFSFVLLAFMCISLKASGQAFGWGIHFQNPHFLLFVFLVLFAFTASLWGMFEIDLPLNIGNLLLGHETKGKVKDFLSGMFATLLATPCSAPFVGTALSFALARSPQDILLVFFFLGCGFATPYFIISAIPSRFAWLPKPGPWMSMLQKILGLFMAGTALWVGWILSFHLPLWAIGGSLLLLAVGLSFFWIKHHRRLDFHPWRFALPVFLFAWGLSWVPHEQVEKKPRSSEIAAPFDEKAISSLVSQGKVVFVDVTAQWCVTCAVNKNLVLGDEALQKLFASLQVVLMRADWTKKDQAVTAFLQKYGRYGIPFNIVFGPQAPQGIALPEILNVKIVEEALRQAATH